MFDRVLIDTWWNVNLSVSAIISGQSLSFNRYMVECEYIKMSCMWKNTYSFNRYMVECECGWAGTIEEMISGFNRYMVECESK